MADARIEGTFGNRPCDMFNDSSNVVVTGKNVIVFAVYNANVKNVQPRDGVTRIRALTSQIVMTYAGHCETGREIWLEAKTECDEFSHGSKGPTVSHIANYIAGLLQNIADNVFTNYVIAGFDDEGLNIYKINKFGIENQTNAAIIGYKEDEATNYLNAHYDPYNEFEGDDLIKVGIGCLLATEQSHLSKFDIIMLYKDKPLAILTVDDVADYIDALFNEGNDLLRRWLNNY